MEIVESAREGLSRWGATQHAGAWHALGNRKTPRDHGLIECDETATEAADWSRHAKGSRAGARPAARARGARRRPRHHGRMECD
jgi:hypothetical protein